MDAHLHGQFVTVMCTWCSPRIIRYYRPVDIFKLVGDRHVIDLQHRFRCEKCQRKDYMEVSFEMILGDKLKGLVIRELLEIRTVKRPVWRDKQL